MNRSYTKKRESIPRVDLDWNPQGARKVESPKKFDITDLFLYLKMEL